MCRNNDPRDSFLHAQLDAVLTIHIYIHHFYTYLYRVHVKIAVNNGPVIPPYIFVTIDRRWIL